MVMISVRLSCNHFRVVRTLHVDGVEWCPVCRGYMTRRSIAPYEPSTRRKRTKHVNNPDNPTLFDVEPDERDGPPPF